MDENSQITINKLTADSLDISNDISANDAIFNNIGSLKTISPEMVQVGWKNWGNSQRDLNWEDPYAGSNINRVFRFNYKGDIVVTMNQSYRNADLPNASKTFGLVLVHKYNGNDWSLYGDSSGIEGSDEYYASISSIDINGIGNRIAIGISNFNAIGGEANGGLVRIFELNTDNIWQPIKDIQGNTAQLRFGKYISFNYSGNVIAVMSERDKNDNTGSSNAFAEVFYENKNSDGGWGKVGGKIAQYDSNTQTDGDELNGGFSNARVIALNKNSGQNDGIRLIVGEYFYSNSLTHVRKNGRVSMWQWNGGTWNSFSSGSWARMGNYITYPNELPQNNDQTNAAFGWSVAINSTGDIVVIGQPSTYQPSFNRTPTRVYLRRWDGSTWNKLGAPYGGDNEGLSTNDSDGYSVDINADGTIICLGGKYVLDTRNDYQSGGKVYVYQWNNGTDFSSGSYNLIKEYTSVYRIISLNGVGDKIGIDTYGIESLADILFESKSITISADISGNDASFNNIKLWGNLSGNDASFNNVELRGDMSGNNVTFKKINLDGKYILNELTQEIKSTNSLLSTPNQEYFGKSLSIDGNYAIIGANGHNNSSGKVYFFEKDNNGTWTEKNNFPGESSSQLGRSVAISGNYAIAGAPFDSNTGKVYFYKKNVSNVWQQIESFVSDDINSNSRFGKPVDLYGNNAIIGARFSGDNSEGSAYIYQLSDTGVSKKNKLMTSDLIGNSKFGSSVAIDENYAIIAKSVGSDNLLPTVCIFKKKTDGNWGELVSDKDYRTETQIIRGSDTVLGNLFGVDVAIYNDYIMVTDNKVHNLYIFKKDANGNWGKSVSGETYRTETQKITGLNSIVSVSISGNNAIVSGFESFYILKLIDGLWENVIEKKPTQPFIQQVTDIDGNDIMIGVANNNNNVGSIYFYENAIKKLPFCTIEQDKIVGEETDISANDASFNSLFIHQNINANNLILSATGKIAINMETNKSLYNRRQDLATFSINETEDRGYDDDKDFVASFRPNALNTGANLLLRGNTADAAGVSNSNAGLYFGTPYTMNDKNNCAIIAEYKQVSDGNSEDVGLSKLHICTGLINGQTTYGEASIQNSKLTIDYNGNVGIGIPSTRSPLTDLHIHRVEELGGSGLLLSGGNYNHKIYFKYLGTSGDPPTYYDFNIASIESDGEWDNHALYFKTAKESMSTRDNVLRTRMTILGNGNVGIGISPSYKLEVNGTFKCTDITCSECAASGGARFGSTAVSSSRRATCEIDGGESGSGATGVVPSSQSDAAYFAGSGTSWIESRFNPSSSYDLYVGYTIWVNSTIYVSSDKRIKKNIIEINDSLSLQKLRDISCCTYEYADKLFRKSGQNIGFIAQQVKEHVPQAINIEKKVIPDVMKNLTNIYWNDTKMNSSELQDVSGIKYRFYVGDNSSNLVRKEVIGNPDGTFIFEKKWNYIFCYGKEVDDFHVLDKNKLFAINFSATQEIDRIQQAEKTKLAAAEAEITTLKNKVTSLENTLVSVMTRLNELERKI